MFSPFFRLCLTRLKIEVVYVGRLVSLFLQQRRHRLPHIALA
jgi:hypothetical protein